MSKRIDRSLGTKHFSDKDRGPLPKKKPVLRATTVLIWALVLVAGVVLYSTSRDCIQSPTCVLKD